MKSVDARMTLNAGVPSVSSILTKCAIFSHIKQTHLLKKSSTMLLPHLLELQELCEMMSVFSHFCFLSLYPRMSWPCVWITQSHRLPSFCPHLFLHAEHPFLLYSTLTLPSQLITISFWYLRGWLCLYKEAFCNMTRDPLVPHQGQRAEENVANTGNSWLVIGNSISLAWGFPHPYTA